MTEYKKAIYRAYADSEIFCKSEWCRQNKIPFRSLNDAISTFGPVHKGNQFQKSKHNYLLEKPRNEIGQYTPENYKRNKSNMQDVEKRNKSNKQDSHVEKRNKGSSKESSKGGKRNLVREWSSMLDKL